MNRAVFDALVETFLDLWDGEEDVVDVLEDAWSQLNAAKADATFEPPTSENGYPF